MTRNSQLLEEVADIIEAKPHLYNQQTWIGTQFNEDDLSECGTMACIAGWAVLVSHQEEIQATWSKLDRIGRNNFLDVLAMTFKPEDQGNYDVHAQAADLLGLDTHEAHALFYGLWQPVEGMTASEALRALAKNDPAYDVRAVTDPSKYYSE